MEPTRKLVGDVTIVLLPMESLDASNIKKFKHHLAPIIERHKKVVFDLEVLQFVDSSGLGALLSCLRQLNATGGNLKLCSMSKPVRTLFELVRMHRIFDIYNNQDEAVRAFHSEVGSKVAEA